MNPKAEMLGIFFSSGKFRPLLWREIVERCAKIGLLSPRGFLTDCVNMGLVSSAELEGSNGIMIYEITNLGKTLVKRTEK